MACSILNSRPSPQPSPGRERGQVALARPVGARRSCPVLPSSRAQRSDPGQRASSRRGAAGLLRSARKVGGFRPENVNRTRREGRPMSGYDLDAGDAPPVPLPEAAPSRLARWRDPPAGELPALEDRGGGIGCDRADGRARLRAPLVAPHNPYDPAQLDLTDRTCRRWQADGQAPPTSWAPTTRAETSSRPCSTAARLADRGRLRGAAVGDDRRRARPARRLRRRRRSTR